MVERARLLQRWSEVRVEFEHLAELDADTQRHRLDALALRDAELAALVADVVARDRASAPAALRNEAPPAVSGARLGPFRLLRPLGEGGMGTVWDAEQDSPRRPVAVKVLHPSLTHGAARARFEAEAEILAHLHHPHIARVLASGVSVGPAGDFEFAWIALERVTDARDIFTWAAQVRPALEERLRVFLAALDAVQHAHERGVLHRDLKSSNVLVDGTGEPKVIDFGIARRLATGSELTRAGEMWGSLASLAPEQVAQDGPPGVRADVYALGTLLFELIAGQPPIDIRGAPPHEAARRIVELPPLSLTACAPNAPKELEWIAARALAKDPRERYASAGDFAADIRRMLAGQAVLAAPPSALYLLSKWARRHRTKLVLVGAAAVLVLATVGYGIHARDARLRAEVSAFESAQAAEAEVQERAQLGSLFEFAIQEARLVGGGGAAELTAVMERLQSAVDSGHGTEGLAEITLRGALVRLWSAAGEYGRARDLGERNLAAIETLGLRQSARGARCLRDLGVARGMLGDAEGARALLEEARALGAVGYVGSAVAPVETLVSLGAAALANGQTRVARDHFNTAVLLGEELDLVPRTRWSTVLASLSTRSQCGEMAAVEAELLRLRPALATEMGGDHLLLVELELVLAQCIADQDRAAEALVLLETIEPRARALWPSGTQRALQFDFALSRVRYSAGDRTEGLRLARDTAQALESRLGTAHPFTARAAALVALCEDESGDSAAARERIARALLARGPSAEPSAKDPPSLELALALARIEQRAGAADARARLEVLSEELRTVLGPAAPRVRRVEHWIRESGPPAPQ